MHYLKLFSCLLFLSFTFLLSCGDDNMQTDPCAVEFNQKALFLHVADQLILPDYEELQLKVNGMIAAAQTFLDDPDAAYLLELKDLFVESYLVWQRVAPYEFGPAEEVFLRNSLNNFPTDTTAINSTIISGIFDFDLPENYDKGLPAIDYLLYGLAANDSLTVLQFTEPGIGEKRGQYLLAVLNDMKERVDYTLDKWQSEYKPVFVQNTGTAAGSSLSLLINNLNQNYELIKREKIGIPSGVLTLGIPNPDKVEAVYSGISKDLAFEAIMSSYHLFLGQSQTGVNGIGLDNYLDDVGAMKDDEPLRDIIENQFITAANSLLEIGEEETMQQAIENNVAVVENIYAEVSKQVVNIKTDMPSVLCVSITYIDNPSDSD